MGSKNIIRKTRAAFGRPYKDVAKSLSSETSKKPDSLLSGGVTTKPGASQSGI